ncbi:hypothetical protein D3C80_1197800 [compost metagenome]
METTTIIHDKEKTKFGVQFTCHPITKEVATKTMEAQPFWIMPDSSGVMGIVFWQREPMLIAITERSAKITPKGVT